MKKQTPHLLIAGVVSACVLIAVVYGIILAGSPADERARRFDQERVNRLQMLAGAVQSYYDEKHTLPSADSALNAIMGQQGGERSSNYSDPETNKFFDYTTVSATSFSLCATFAFPAGQTANYAMPVPPPYEKYPGVSFQFHKAGYQCFAIDVTDSGTACDALRACQPGFSCVSLPGKTGGTCVAVGQECAVAGCQAGCQLLESYPVQVRCIKEPVPQDNPVGNGCQLFQETKTGRVDCFGCGKTVCKDPASGWTSYSATRKPGTVGIPYGCTEGKNGCELVQ